MFVRIIAPAATDGTSSSGEGGHPAGPGSGTSPLWMRVLALEIFRGLCGDFELMMKFYQRYDAAASDQSKGKGKGKSNEGGVTEGSTIFCDLMTAFNRLATERPAVLGTGNAVLYGSSMGPSTLSHHHSSTASLSTSNLSSPEKGGGSGSAMIDSAMEMGLGLAHAAGSVVGSGVAGAVAGAASVGLHATSPNSIGLNASTASMKLQCIDQLDKADPPAIPETYIFLLALQCLAALADGFSTFTLTTYSSILSERAKSTGKPISKAPAAIEWEESQDEEDSLPYPSSLRLLFPTISSPILCRLSNLSRASAEFSTSRLREKLSSPLSANSPSLLPSSLISPRKTLSTNRNSHLLLQRQRLRLPYYLPELNL